MKLLLDLQGAQSQSRHRGIGRYTLALTRAFLDRAASEHDVRLLLNARFGDQVDALIATLGEHARPAHRLVVEVPEGIRAQPGGNAWLRRTSARVMRHAIESSGADIVWYSSILEGYNDDAVVPETPPVGIASVATLYDLIPLHDQDAYLGHPRIRQWYGQSVDMLKQCDMLLAISEWVRQDAIQRLQLPPERVVNIGAAVDDWFAPPTPDPAASAALRSRYGITRPYVLYNGGFDARKNVPSLVRAFAALPEAMRAAHQLVIVGRAGQEEAAQLHEATRKARLPADSVIYTGFAPDEELIRLYAECALFVFPSLLEGFGLPPLEAMACGAPVIASHAASLPEVIDKRDALFNPHRVDDITACMSQALGNAHYADELRKYGCERAPMFSWNSVANRALDALQELAHRQNRRPNVAIHGNPLAREEQLIADISRMDGKPSDEDLASIASMVISTRKPEAVQRWLVDVSSIAEKDIRTGVQRVVRNILTHWLISPPEGVQIVPIRFARGRYRHARQYAFELLGREKNPLPEDAIEAVNGDVFFGLDWAVDAIDAAEPQLRQWHRRGASVQFLIHDLLPIMLPNAFHPYARDRFARWLRCAATVSDNLICVSRATADDLNLWLATTSIRYQFGRAPEVTHSPPGVDPSFSSAEPVLRPLLAVALRSRPTFLMVGTIEPRKGYDQALEALEQLWNDGIDVNLVVVGHYGWLMEPFRARLEAHAQYNRRLYWIHDANDDELDAIYRASTWLLAASWGEGYGLPLIEATLRNIPVIARDLPVFREVMGEQAQYFKAQQPSELADVLRNLLSLEDVPSPVKSFPTWQESAASLSSVIKNLISDESA